MPPSMYQFRGNDRGRSRPPRDFSFRYQPPKTAARPLLRSHRETTPEMLGGSKNEEEKSRKFLSVDDITDSDEAEMEVSSADEDDADQPPRKKRAVEDEDKPVANAPKWSNPDPYTALPPPDDSQVKRRDVVKLIRKARIQATASQQPKETNAVVSNDDFISFGTEFPEDEAPPNAPRGPRQDGDPALGNRKRTFDDEIKGPKRGGMPQRKTGPRGSILEEWLPARRDDPTPWLDQSGPSSLNLGTRLHNEIASFYHWVRPRSFEQTIRSDLISSLQRLFQQRSPGSQLRAFGSFAAGLYLPIADMDLVLLSPQFMRSGRKTLCQRPQHIHQFGYFIKDLDIAVPGSIETIAHARVPIIKFVDRFTGLKVDLSFDNSTGVVANETFQSWKTYFPEMPVIVSIIKQFLLLRGLNEVPTGGLGGFSIICLVTSLLQHMPRDDSGPNFGSILMDFLDFYGNHFNLNDVGIQLEPPRYFTKEIPVYHKSKGERLCIIDPNNPDNDISGGTKEISLIFDCFANAYRVLKDRMTSSVMSSTDNKSSFLEEILGANYESYFEQREHLRRLFENDPRFSQPPPPPSLPPPPLPSPPPQPSSRHTLPKKPKETSRSSSGVSKAQRKQDAAKDRAVRFRQLRPDVNGIPKSLSNELALKLGGYSTQSEMDRDLYARENARGAERVGSVPPS